MFDRFTQRSHWPTSHWMVPLVRFANKNGVLPQDGQYVPQAVIDRLALFEDLEAEPYELQEALEFWRSKTTPLWQIPDPKREEEIASSEPRILGYGTTSDGCESMTVEMWGREIKLDYIAGAPKLCFAYIAPRFIPVEAALFEVNMKSSNWALWVIELKEPVNPHDYTDTWYFVEVSLSGEVFAKDQFYFSNPSRLVSKSTHERSKKK